MKPAVHSRLVTAKQQSVSRMNLKSLHGSLKHLLRIAESFQKFSNAGSHRTFLASRTRVRALFSSRVESRERVNQNAYSVTVSSSVTCHESREPDLNQFNMYATSLCLQFSYVSLL